MRTGVRPPYKFRRDGVMGVMHNWLMLDTVITARAFGDSADCLR